MKKTLFWLALSFPLLALSQPQTELFRSVFDTLSKKSTGAYFGHKTGQANSFSDDFTRLSWNFSDDDLVYIARNATPLMEASAGNELVRRKSKAVAALFADQLKNSGRIVFHQGENATDAPLAVCLFQNIAFQKEIMERKTYFEQTSTPAQIRGLKVLFGRDYDSPWSVAESDSLMNVLATMAIRDSAATPEIISHVCLLNHFRCQDYARIRQYAQRYPTPEILATLATFHNKNDLPLLRQHLTGAMVAISFFPHPSLFPLLKSRLATDYENPDYQQAVAAFKSRESKQVLQSICKKIAAAVQSETRDRRLYALHDLLEKSDCPLYNDLIVQLEKNI